MTFYGNAAAFKTYHQARGKTIPGSWTDSIIEAALLVSSEWLDNKYGSVWVGYPTGGFTQERKWPRAAAVTNTYPQYVFSNSEIPVAVVNSTYEAAYRELTTPNTLQKDFTPNKYTKVAVSGAISVEYNTSITSTDVQLQIPVVDSLMESLIDEETQGSFSPYSGESVRT